MQADGNYKATLNPQSEFDGQYAQLVKVAHPGMDPTIRGADNCKPFLYILTSQALNTQDLDYLASYFHSLLAA